VSVNRSKIFTDDELLELIRQEDRAAFELIYNRYWSKLYISAYKILRDRQSSEDIVQEVLVQLWLKRSTQQIESLNAYLYTAVRFQVFTAIRKNKVRETLFAEIEEMIDFNSAEDNLVVLDITRKLEESIADLPEKCREIFSLSRKEQLSTKEIAARLGISPKTVENQLTIAFRKLKVSMGDVLFGLAVIIIPLWKK
jgi:RNA polymerase sigma-70 factor (family 1)